VKRIHVLRQGVWMDACSLWPSCIDKGKARMAARLARNCSAWQIQLGGFLGWEISGRWELFPN